MMKKSIDSPFRKLKMLLVLPLIAMVFYAFAKPEYISLPATSTGTGTITMIADALNELKAPTAAPVDKSGKVAPVEKSKIVKGKVVNSDGKPWPGTSVILVGSVNGTMTDKEGHFELKDVPNDGELAFSFVGYETVRVKPDFKNPMTIKMVPAVVGLDKVVVVGYDGNGKTMPTSTRIKIESIDSENPPLYVVDGVITEKRRAEYFIEVGVESANVLKGKSATDKYGEKGKNGVMEVTLKKNVKGWATPDTSTHLGILIRGIGSNLDPTSQNPPLYVLDGAIVDKTVIDALNPKNNIASIEVLKDKSATILYGDKGKNGVVLITSKKNQGASNGNKEGDVKVVGFGKMADFKPSDPVFISNQGGAIRSIDPKNPPLYVLDGTIVDKAAIDALNSNKDIASIEVLQDKSATDKYGDKGKNGVVMITSKGKAAASSDQKEGKATKSDTKEKEVFIVVESMPEFPGGKDALMKFIQTNIKYPAEAQKAKAQGSVIVTFVVNSNGKVERAKVVRSVHPALDAEAMRVIGLLPLQPDWKPGKQRGVAVDVAYTLPIEFTLQ